MTRSITANRTASSRERLAASRGLVTVLVALVVLIVLGETAAPSSVSHGAILGMLPFAAVLAIASLGQTLVVMQGGIDLSVAGTISLVVVIITHEAYGHDAKVLPAVLMALGAAVLAGFVNGFLIGRLGLNPIVATLGTNALLYSAVLGVSGGTPRQTTDRMAKIAGGESFGIPNAVYFAVVAGIINKPTAYQGDTYVLASVAAVVLGGTSLLGGRGNIVASFVAAIFLTQLEQFVLALGVTFAVQTLVQAAALTIGVALYTVNWSKLRPSRRSRPLPAPA